MFYLIQTPYHSRPYLTSVAFLARDFRCWGCRVDVFPDNSPYVAEIRRREKKSSQSAWRIELMEHWSRETISRRQRDRQRAQDRGYQVQTVTPMMENGSSTENLRLQRTSSVLQDFIEGVAVSSRPNTVYHASSNDPRPLPSGVEGLASKYARLLQSIRYTTNCPLPDWSDPEFFIADRVTLDFRCDEVLQREHLTQALHKATSKNMGRMGNVERDSSKGIFRVILFVEVSDLVVPQENIGEEKVDPLPLYERVEKPPAYVDA